MLSESERARFNTLRNRQSYGETLSFEESAEVAAITRRIEEAEAAYLAPATEKLRTERLAAEERVRRLTALYVREAEFTARLEHVLAELKQERSELLAERSQLLTAAAT